jgi:probable rRNA maturation factor
MQTVHITDDYQGIKISTRRLKQLVRTVCERFDAARAVIGIAIMDDARMIALNKQFLDKTGTTDCFSFDLSDTDDPRAPRNFEIVVNGQMALQQARTRGHTPEAELALYITHGLLHQLGFDDQTRSAAREMHRIEDEILKGLGYGMVYNSRHK